MLAESILQRLEAEFDSPPETIRKIAELFEQGATPEYIALFQRDETGDPGEENLVQLHERLRFLQELETRKATLLDHAAALERTDVAELKDLLEGTVDQDFVDDVDHLLRPHEHKLETRVRELGLGDLLDAILAGDLGGRPLSELAESKVDPEHGLASADDVLAQLVLALAERFGEDPKLRSAIRNELSRGILKAEPADGGLDQHVEPEAAAAEEAAAEATDASATEATADADAPAEAGSTDAASTDAEAPAGDGATDETPAASADASPQAEAVADAAAAAATSDENADDPAPAAAEAPAATEAATADHTSTGAGATDAPEATEVSAESGNEPAPAAPAPRREERPRGGRGKRRGGNSDRYREFLDLAEPVRRVPAHRMLALRRAEREGILRLRLELEEGRELDVFRRRFSPEVDPSTPLGQFLDLVYGHAYDQHVHRAAEQIVRLRLKEKADRETVRTFARTLRSQLMSPALPDEVCASLRVSGRSAWFVVLGVDGSPRKKLNLPVPEGDADRSELVAAIAEVVEAERPAAIAIPHGRRERPARRLADAVLKHLDEKGAFAEHPRPMVIPVDETASVVWATSANARKRHGNSDSGMRTTLSLARRLHDPLLELIRVEPRGLGLGQNLPEVHQGLLKRQLDTTASSCLARIGVDVNRADQGLLVRLPGVSQTVAKAIVQHRGQHGPFARLADLAQLEPVDGLTLRFIGGFLRVHGGAEPLDATSIHPDDYELAQRVAAKVDKTPGELLGGPPVRVAAKDLGDEPVGPRRLEDVVHGLSRGASDPRGRVTVLANEGVSTFADLKLDQLVTGRITNLTEFGAFVDLGIGHDGLVHLSQIPPQRLRDPEQVLCVGEVVQVYVVHLDEKARKIGLSFHKPRHVAEGRAATLGERMGGRGNRRGRGGRDRDRGGENVMTRAARAPDGRRPGGRRGPKPKFAGAGGGGGGSDDRGPRPERRGGGRGRPDGRGRGEGRGRNDGQPRVITVESDAPEQDIRGHKGELRSLSSLKNLLKPKSPDGESDA